jgi:hypothetical protein
MEKRIWPDMRLCRKAAAERNAAFHKMVPRLEVPARLAQTLLDAKGRQTMFPLFLNALLTLQRGRSYLLFTI